MNTLDAMKLALEALDYVGIEEITSAEYKEVAKATANLKQAIDEYEEAEPVAWMDIDGCLLIDVDAEDIQPRWVPLYAHPPKKEWVGLTKGETYGCNGGFMSDEEYDLARAIEAKLKEKNS
jgi:hypothetical protein